MLDRVITHVLWIVSYTFPVVLAGLYLTFVSLPNDRGFTDVILFVVGAVLGNLFLLLDAKFLYPRYNELRTVPERLITRGLVFVIAYVAAGIFVVTSSGSSTGIGMVLAIGYSILAEMFAYLYTKREAFAPRFLYQVNRRVGPAEETGYVLAFLAVMIGLTTFGVF